MRDHVGFYWTARETDALIQHLTSNDPVAREPRPALIGGISPHDDYLYAGSVYFLLYSAIQPQEVIMVGVTHATLRKELSEFRDIIMTDDLPLWTGSYGAVNVVLLKSYIAARLNTSFWRVNRTAHTIERLIEATFLFLQHYSRDVVIAPIMVTAISFERMCRVADSLAFIIASMSVRVI